MVSNRPIAIGPKDSDFAEIITNTNTGVFYLFRETKTKSGLFIISFRRKNYNPMELVYKIFQKKPNQTIG
jgi:hypothetical protein